jgi:hypothetical protein
MTSEPVRVRPPGAAFNFDDDYALSDSLFAGNPA